MQLNDRSSNYEATNGIISTLIDQKLENLKKQYLCFLKSLT